MYRKHFHSADGVVHLPVCRLFISFQSAQPASPSEWEFIAMHLVDAAASTSFLFALRCDGIRFPAKILFHFWLTLLLYHLTMYYCIPSITRCLYDGPRRRRMCVSVRVCGRIGEQRKSKVLASTFSSCYISQDFMQKIQKTHTMTTTTTTSGVSACACFKTRLTTRLAWIQLKV